MVAVVSLENVLDVSAGKKRGRNEEEQEEEEERNGRKKRRGGQRDCRMMILKITRTHTHRCTYPIGERGNEDSNVPPLFQPSLPLLKTFIERSNYNWRTGAA